MALVSDLIMLLGDKGNVRKITLNGNLVWSTGVRIFLYSKINAQIQSTYEVSRFSTKEEVRLNEDNWLSLGSHRKSKRVSGPTLEFKVHALSVCAIPTKIHKLPSNCISIFSLEYLWPELLKIRKNKVSYGYFLFLFK